jgi:hypothetical protein
MVWDKMVGSFRGKNRRVFWRNLFKDSSFQKRVVSAGGARVRTKARMLERAKDEVEAKLAEDLRKTKRQLQIREKETQEIERLREDRLREQEREARKAEKTMTVGHKRELAAMRGDLERTRVEDIQIQQELVRKGRLKVRRITNELAKTQQHLVETEETNVGLAKEVITGTAKLNSLREEGSRWKGKYLAVAGNVRGKTREIQKELEEKQQHLLAKEDTNGVLSTSEVMQFLDQYSLHGGLDQKKTWYCVCLFGIGVKSCLVFCGGIYFHRQDFTSIQTDTIAPEDHRNSPNPKPNPKPNPQPSSSP